MRWPCSLERVEDAGFASRWTDGCIQTGFWEVSYCSLQCTEYASMRPGLSGDTRQQPRPSAPGLLVDWPDGTVCSGRNCDDRYSRFLFLPQLHGAF